MSRLVPSARVRAVNDEPVRPDGRFVVYWMTSARRLTHNFALDRAIEHARALGKPLLILEALGLRHRWASDRLHRFVLEGMIDNAARARRAAVVYHPYVEPTPREARGLIAQTAAFACCVVTDDYPCFFLPKILAAARAQTRVRLEAVDSNGILPMRATDKVYPSAYAFRRFLQKSLPEHLLAWPKADPLARLELPRLDRLPEEISSRWLSAGSSFQNLDRLLGTLPIDHEVPGASFRGGANAGRASLDRFVAEQLSGYGERRNEPEQDATSGLSPYLHFGHVGAHQVVRRIIEHEDWSLPKLATKASGGREGWWGMSPAAEAFLDQVVTWRELGFNFCRLRSDYGVYESLPEWARATLEQHASDPRDHVYALEDFEAARTHDPLWNAAQSQLVSEGRMHNYLRMLWGKKILEWTPHPRDALAVMLELNNKYAVDGRDPNSYSGIFWTLGRYDRPWGPERPIFGKVRYMSSDNTRRKYKVARYLERYGAPKAQLGLSLP